MLLSLPDVVNWLFVVAIIRTMPTTNKNIMAINDIVWDNISIQEAAIKITKNEESTVLPLA